MSGDCSTSNGSDGLKLSEIYDKLWDIWEYTDSTDDPSVSDAFQSKVKAGRESGERAISMVNELRLYSDNEELEEVASNEIKYMLLPALLASLQMKMTGDDRMSGVKSAKIYYQDFLRMCRNYGVTDYDVPEITDVPETKPRPPPAPTNSRPTPQELIAMTAKRQQKIERFKQQKETEKQLKEMRPLVEREHVDDEVKRIYYTTLLQRWVSISLEELESIEGELEILEHMAKMRASGAPLHPPKTQQRSQSTFRPFILTKSDIQKRVFGAGYPSLPTYTVEEFYEQQAALGNLPGPGSGGLPGDPADEAAAREKEDEEKERKVEVDDKEALEKARGWEEWTDEHRRGWGNTQNKG